MEAEVSDEDTQLVELTIIQRLWRRIEATVRVLLVALHHSSIRLHFGFMKSLNHEKLSFFFIFQKLYIFSMHFTNHKVNNKLL